MKKKDQRTNKARCELNQKKGEIENIHKDKPEIKEFLDLKIPLLVKKHSLNKIYEFVNRDQKNYLLGHVCNTSDVFNMIIPLNWDRIKDIISKTKFINKQEVTESTKKQIPPIVFHKMENKTDITYITIYTGDTESLAIFFMHTYLPTGIRRKSTDNRLSEIFSFNEDKIITEYHIKGHLFQESKPDSQSNDTPIFIQPADPTKKNEQNDPNITSFDDFYA